MTDMKLTPTNQIAEMSREELIPVLTQVDQIYQQQSSAAHELKVCEIMLSKKEPRCEEIRNQVSEQTRRRWTRIGWIVGLCSFGFFLIFWYFLRKSAYEKDREQNRAHNEREAQAYYEETIVPLLEKQDDLQAQLRELETSGALAWAKDIVTPEIFDMGAASELRKLVENRRADTLKEALNLFDSNQYRERMAAMQEGMLANSDTMAAETARQTQLLQETERSARETARASQWTAVNTYRSYQAQRRQARNNRRNHH